MFFFGGLRWGVFWGEGFVCLKKLLFLKIIAVRTCIGCIANKRISLSDIPKCSSCFSMLTHTPLVLIVLSLSLAVTYCWDDNCQTHLTDVEIVKDLSIELNGQQVMVNCIGRVRVHKCEGTCESKVTPSVLHHPGFNKVGQVQSQGQFA